jgi:AMP nucleosidase
MQNSTSHIGLPFAAEHFTDPAAAVERVREIYNANTAYLRDCFKRFSAGESIQQRVHACYPFVRVHTEIGTRVDTRLSYGFVAGPGTYATTVTRPDLFSHYFLEQFELLRRNHGVVLEVGVSRQPIPIHFAFPEGLHVEGDLTPQRLARLPQMPAYHLTRPTAAASPWSTSASAPATPRPSPTTSPCCARMPG